MFKIKEKEEKGYKTINFNDVNEYCTIELLSDGKEYVVMNHIADMLIKKGLARQTNSRIEEQKINNQKK